MRLLLTHGFFLAEDPKEQQILRPYPPLGILYISAYLRSRGFDVDVYDSTWGSREELFRILDDGPPAMLGLYANLLTRRNALAIIQRAKANGWKVIAGGPEPANYTDEYLEAGADYVVPGEGELVIERLLMGDPAPDGVVYYRCASRICAAGSVVSYKVQPHRTTLTLADFETHHRGLAKANSGSGRIRDVRIVEPMARTIEGVRVLQVSREVDWADGTTTFSIEARLIGADRSFSLVSDSPKREWTANNFDGFLRRLVDIAGIRRP